MTVVFLVVLSGVLIEEGSPFLSTVEACPTLLARLWAFFREVPLLSAARFNVRTQGHGFGARLTFDNHHLHRWQQRREDHSPSYVRPLQSTRHRQWCSNYHPPPLPELRPSSLLRRLAELQVSSKAIGEGSSRCTFFREMQTGQVTGDMQLTFCAVVPTHLDYWVAGLP